MGRRPIGRHAMSDAERQRRRRERLAAERAAQPRQPSAPSADADKDREIARLRKELAQARAAAKASAEIDPATLSMSAQKKLDAAIKAKIKQIEREYDAKRIKENTEHWERMFPTLEREQQEAAETRRIYQQFMQEQKKIFTVAEFRIIISCLHPDSRKNTSDAKLKEAFRLFNAQRFALTGEKS
jgi:hypothetical protein